MLKVEIDLDQLQEVINNAVDKAIKRHALKDSLPALLTRKQFMQLLDIGDTKASELLNRKDFPVFREAGHPKVPTKQLFEWIDQNTNWVQKNTSYLNRVI
ncbi:helix-turn-helix domain-containing protein [Jeotgalibacillus proteolyticus]|uniref:DNA-binding protein n=1 Tax=Jeotgalibacillus proteolyticus TaxID=2082395 RepID=A0A2S5GAQ2_9BACL|nr:helix-turn-helix domain-containing protein [Jeotgalibacillus proteolyticus]PPA70076.1 hypothetical protein C4B60_10825 [Jeotgalibacillus proteolyticus]